MQIFVQCHVLPKRSQLYFVEHFYLRIRFFNTSKKKDPVIADHRTIEEANQNSKYHHSTKGDQNRP